ncbi:TadE family protein [Methylophaga lonarensis]|uniref:TadE family protein n=1 Tax=Methylophaga lonarensis TaxID=999151 RepID=UPI003D2A3300
MSRLTNHLNRNDRPVSLKYQRGAAAIEAALLFVIFFSLFYAIVSYSLPMLLMQSFNHAAASGARAAVAVDPNAFSDTNDYISSGVEPRVRAVVADTLSWLPAAARAQVLGNNNQNIAINFNPGNGMLTVTVAYNGYRNNPLVPVLRLPAIGDVPRLPDDLSASAMIAL